MGVKYILVLILFIIISHLGIKMVRIVGETLLKQYYEEKLVVNSTIILLIFTIIYNVEFLWPQSLVFVKIIQQHNQYINKICLKQIIICQVYKSS